MAELMFLTVDDPVATQELKNPHPLLFILSLPKADVSVSWAPSNISDTNCAISAKPQYDSDANYPVLASDLTHLGQRPTRQS